MIDTDHTSEKGVITDVINNIHDKASMCDTCPKND